MFCVTTFVTCNPKPILGVASRQEALCAVALAARNEVFRAYPILFTFHDLLLCHHSQFPIVSVNEAVLFWLSDCQSMLPKACLDSSTSTAISFPIRCQRLYCLWEISFIPHIGL